VVQRVYSLSKIPSSYESSLVSQQSIQSLVEEVVVPMQSSIDPTFFLESDESTKVVLSMKSSVNPTLLLESNESTKVVSSMQSSTNPTPLSGSDASFNYVFSISSSVPSEQGGIPLSSSMLPPSPRMVSFD
jgi:hypothetical protein